MNDDPSECSLALNAKNFAGSWRGGRRGLTTSSHCAVGRKNCDLLRPPRINCVQISCSIANEKAVSKNLESRGQKELIQEEELRESKRRMDTRHAAASPQQLGL
jgi:hypothetical protein